MKRETSVFLITALLLHHAPTWAQEADKDLSALMGDEGEPSIEGDEVPETNPEATTVETPASPQAPDVDLSSETIDLQDIEMSDAVTPDETPTTSPETQKVEVDEGQVDLDSDPVQDIPTQEAAKVDDLETLKSDMDGDIEFKPSPIDTEEEKAAKAEKLEESKQAAAAKKAVTPKKQSTPEIFDVGREERDLLAIAQNIQGQISDTEWSEVATAAKTDTYTVVKDDWLFKISKKLFGTGFFYPKIWSLNSYITNPHYIEPGMILSFTTGSGSMAPQVKLGAFTDGELNSAPGSSGTGNPADLANFGDDAKPKWLDEKRNLEDQGIYFQYASEETMDDLAKAGEQALNREYESYEPPRSDFDVIVPSNYDASGFDKNSRVYFSVKEGYYLSTFVSTNIVQDFGSITDGIDENIFFTRTNRAFVQFDGSMNALPGDKFSVYTSLGKATHPNSDREGYKYAIVAQVKLIRKIRDKWEIEFTEVSGTPQRGDRITAYTPKIERITKTFNSRLIEAGILSSYHPNQTLLSFGDVLYLDRGRADGVEMGNVFEVYGFKDRGTKQNITDQPTYKTGELTVITLTDNFATVLVTATVKDFYLGDLALTKTKESVLRDLRAKDMAAQGKKDLMGGKALEELDVELNLENLNDDLLKQADKINLTEDELAELERQEREKSVIKDSERDLKALERLEGEIEQAEGILNDANLNEDKLLENQNLNEVEKNQGLKDQESLDEIEENLGKRFMDEDLNSKDNPYGLSEFDVEEVDELLNVEKDATKKE